jgi:hypothetical protein
MSPSEKITRKKGKILSSYETKRKKKEREALMVTWLEARGMPSLASRLAALAMRSALKLETPTASQSPCSLHMTNPSRYASLLKALKKKPGLEVFEEMRKSVRESPIKKRKRSALFFSVLKDYTCLNIHGQPYHAQLLFPHQCCM